MLSRHITIFFLSVIVVHAANAFDRELLYRNCEEAEKTIGAASIEEKKQLVEFTKNLITVGGPQLTPALPFSLNAPHVAPLFQKEDMQRAFEHENTQASLDCALKVLPLIPDFSADLLPKLIEGAVLEALPRELQIQYEKSLLLISQRLNEAHIQISNQITLRIAEQLKGETLPLALLVLKDLNQMASLVELFSRDELTEGLLSAFSLLSLSGEQRALFLKSAISHSRDASQRKIFEYIFENLPREEFYIEGIHHQDPVIRKVATSAVSKMPSSGRIIFESLTSPFDDVFLATSSFIKEKLSSDIEFQKDAFSFLDNAEEPYISRVLSVLPVKVCGQVIERSPLSSFKGFIHRFALEKSCNDIFIKKVQTSFNAKKISSSEKDLFMTLGSLLQGKITPKEGGIFKKFRNQISADFQEFLWVKFFKEKPKGWLDIVKAIPLSFLHLDASTKITYSEEVGAYFEGLGFEEKRTFISLVRFDPPVKSKTTHRDLLLLFAYNGYPLSKKDITLLGKEKYSCEELLLFGQTVVQFLSNDKRMLCESESITRGVLIVPHVLSIAQITDKILGSDLPVERKFSLFGEILRDISTIHVVLPRLDPLMKRDLFIKIQSSISPTPEILSLLTSEISNSHDEVYTLEIMKVLTRLFPLDPHVRDLLNDQIKDGNQEVQSLIALLPEQQAGLVILGGLQGASVKSMTLLLKSAGRLHSGEQPLLIALKSLTSEAPTREIMFLAQRALASLTMPDQTERNILEKVYGRSRYWMDRDR